MLAGLYSHNTAVFLLVWANVCWLIVWLRSGRPREFLVAWAGINGVVALSFAWWVPIAFHQSVTTLANGNFGKSYTSWRVVFDVLSSDYGGRHLADAGPLVALANTLLAGNRSMAAPQKCSGELKLSGVVLFVPLATATVSFWRPLLSNSVLVWPVAALLVLELIAVVGLSRRMAVLVGAALISINAVALENYYQDEDKPDWRQVTALAASSIRNGDAIAVWPGWQRLPFGYYFKRAQNEVPFRAEVFGITALTPGDTGPLQIWQPNQTKIGLAELTQKFKRIWLIVTWPQNKDDARMRFQQVGQVSEVRRVGDIGIFLVDVRRPVSN